MTEAERAVYRSHNPNLYNSDYVYLDEQNRVINLLNPHFECTDLPQSETDKLYDAHEHFRQPFRRLVVPARSVLRRTAAPLSD